jgi:flagellar basal-body rod modification protein FlgD
MNAASILNVMSAPVRAVTAPIRLVADALDGKDSSASAPAAASAANPAAAKAAAAESDAANKAAASNQTGNSPTVPMSTSGTQQNIDQAQSSLSGDQQMFLKLLTAQLRNQDPLSPLDANQFTAQLVQMNGVQQQILTNQLLNQLVSNQGGLGNAVGLIGKQVSAATAAATLNGGQANWNYSIDAASTDVTLQVIDSAGNVVWQGDGGDLAKGDHTFAWDGKDLTGKQRADGTTYGLRVVAKTTDGEAIGSSVMLKGTVLSVQNIDGQTVVDINGTKVPLSLVSSVTNPSAQA